MKVTETPEFAEWLGGLRDVVGRRAIVRRLLKLQTTDHLGDAKSLGDDLHEMRIHVGPGYRVYYTMLDDGTLLLRGGKKDDQSSDIKRARKMLEDP